MLCGGKQVVRQHHKLAQERSIALVGFAQWQSKGASRKRCWRIRIPTQYGGSWPSVPGSESRGGWCGESVVSWRRNGQLCSSSMRGCLSLLRACWRERGARRRSVGLGAGLHETLVDHVHLCFPFCQGPLRYFSSDVAGVQQHLCMCDETRLRTVSSPPASQRTPICRLIAQMSNVRMSPAPNEMEPQMLYFWSDGYSRPYAC